MHDHIVAVILFEASNVMCYCGLFGFDFCYLFCYFEIESVCIYTCIDYNGD